MTAADAESAPSALDVDQLYRAHAPFLGRVIQRLLGDGPHVDDTLQETFIVAFRRRRDFDEQRAAVRTWLYSIAANLCKRHRRSAQRLLLFRERWSHETVSSAPPPDRELERRDDVALAQLAIRALPFRQRAVFVLYELEELKGQEIAELLDVPVNTVWTRLHKARRNFRRRAERLRHEELP